MFRFDFDRASGVLSVTPRGFWTVREAEAYCEAMEVETKEARARAGTLRLMVDVREHGVQPPEVMERLSRARTAALQFPSDRVAIILGPGLSGAQSKRVIRKHDSERQGRGQARTFETAEAGLGWLARQNRDIAA